MHFQFRTDPIQSILKLGFEHYFSELLFGVVRLQVIEIQIYAFYLKEKYRKLVLYRHNFV